MSKLDIDILYYIFQELNEDKNSLFSCLLINKLCCELVIPILWRHPIKYFIPFNVYLLEEGKKLFDIIILHLSEASKKLLINKNIIIISTKQQKQKLSFNYVSFCKYICIQKIFSYVYIHEDFLNTDQKLLLEHEIYKLFIGECSNVKYLDSLELKHPIYQFPGANICLSKLCELDCKSNQISSLFYGLAQICRLIEKISIELTIDNSGLAELIEMQKQIKYIKITQSELCGYKRIAQALEKQAHSILYLQLSMDNACLYDLFPKLINLQSFILIGEAYCVLNRKFREILMAAIYCKLQILELTRAPLYIATNIIQNTNGNLWKVKIRSNKLNYSRKYIQTIYKYCPNIKYTSIVLNNETLDEIENFLINCKHLEALDVIVVSNNKKLDKFLDLLIKFSSVSLYKVHINPNFFTLKSLNLFFNNWKNRKNLHLYDHDNNWRIIIGVLFSGMKGIVGYENCESFWDIDNYTGITWNDEDSF
ncbi:hypothetical protein C1645_828241 [Glomus cerebriforme]|uniref:F-box domain-containing protein n=1 Tax=Glomus cerebriforme TaxID=658196 RepID=A0A397SSY1_9GLOM|nr:hypothetical protein C1645_828241 [Glomus cerebriforme]